MKNKLMGLVLGIVVGVTVFYLSHEKHKAPVEVSEVKAEKVVKVVPAELAQPLAETKTPQPKVIITPKKPETPREQLMRAVFLDKKVLPKKEERQEMRLLLASDSAIKESGRILLDTSDKATTDKAENLRMRAVDFFYAALSWKDNPSRSKVLKTVEELLLRSFDQGIPKNLRGSMAGDIAELFVTLEEFDPDRAERVFNEGTPAQKKIFRVARNLLKNKTN